MRKFILIAVLLAIPLVCFGQDATTEATPKYEEQTLENKIESKESCEAKGGIWSRWGEFELGACNLPTSDAGQECLDSDECESECITDDEAPAGQEVKGRCYDWSITRGKCLNRVKDGVAEGVICID